MQDELQYSPDITEENHFPLVAPYTCPARELFCAETRPQELVTFTKLPELPHIVFITGKSADSRCKKIMLYSEGNSRKFLTVNLGTKTYNCSVLVRARDTRDKSAVGFLGTFDVYAQCYQRDVLDSHIERLRSANGLKNVTVYAARINYKELLEKIPAI